jgi:hypothetical protein
VKTAMTVAAAVGAVVVVVAAAMIGAAKAIAAPGKLAFDH